jgi:hypothetical protein
MTATSPSNFNEDSNAEFLASLEPSISALLTVAEYANAKNLPEDYLRDVWKLTDRNDGIIIPYHNADGTLFRKKLRRTLSHDKLNGKPFTTWIGDSSTDLNSTPYGLDKLPKGTQVFWFIEGESDTQTAHYRNVLAIGSSGSNGFQEAFAKLPAFADARYIFVVKEPNESGEQFVKQLAKSSIREKFLVVTLPEGIKDISELHLHNIPQRRLRVCYI